MSDAFWEHFFKFALTAFGVYMTWRMQQLGKKVEVVRKNTNSLVHELVTAEKAVSRAEGVKSETDKGKP
jgi:hypothetical protein